MTNKIIITKKTHPGWIEWNKMIRNKKIPEEIKIKYKLLQPLCWFGRFQYFYSMNENTISLISINEILYPWKKYWEIYSFDEKLFEDVKRFKTKKEAEVEIKKIFKTIRRRIK
jgi:hypothetical protein